MMTAEEVEEVLLPDEIICTERNKGKSISRHCVNLLYKEGKVLKITFLIATFYM